MKSCPKTGRQRLLLHWYSKPNSASRYGKTIVVCVIVQSLNLKNSHRCFSLVPGLFDQNCLTFLRLFSYATAAVPTVLVRTRTTLTIVVLRIIEYVKLYIYFKKKILALVRRNPESVRKKRKLYSNFTIFVPFRMVGVQTLKYLSHTHILWNYLTLYTR